MKVILAKSAIPVTDVSGVHMNVPTEVVVREEDTKDRIK